MLSKPGSRAHSAPTLILLVAFLPSSLAKAQTPPVRPGGGASDFATLSAKANAARDADRLDEAVPLYKKALVLRPNWAEGWWSLGTISYDRNSYAEAARAFEKVIKLAPANGTAYVMLGLSEFELGQDEAALKHILKGESLGLDKDPELRHVALYHQGLLLQRAGKFRAAQDVLEQLCAQGVRSDEIANALGMTMLRQHGKAPPPPGSEDAEVVAGVGKAGCLGAQKKFDAGRADFSALVAQHPAYAGIHYAFGLFLVEASDPHAAIAEFKNEISNNHADVISRLQIASASYKTDSAAGIPYAQEAVTMAPRQPFANLLLGLLLLDTDAYRPAIPQLEIAEKAFPRDTRIYLALASAYSRAGRKQDAARARAAFARLTAEANTTRNEQGNESGDARIRVEDSASPQ